jgi:outer membrane receptor protein involved in Fe transport
VVYTGQTLPGYSVLDLMASYKFKSAGVNWTAQINATNVFNRTYLKEAQLSAPIPSNTPPYSWINGVYGDPREVVASVKAEW